MFFNCFHSLNIYYLFNAAKRPARRLILTDLLDLKENAYSSPVTLFVQRTIS